MEGLPFGRYRLIELLGRGGMGEVWRAHDTAIDRVVALKMLLPHYAQDPDFEKRFRREARIAARLDDPHVVPIYDVGEIDDRLYVTMRLIDGVNLQTLLDAGPLEADRAVRIIEQIASALHSAHQAGLVHRDVKPSNILLGRNDFAYLIDFGIARASDESALTSASATVGTWAYMAPERFSSAEIEPSSDIYALTCVLYQCLTGQPPFPGTALEQIAVGHMVTPPPKPSDKDHTISPTMDQVIATGLAKQPTDRYPTTVEMAAAARQAITYPSDSNTPTLPARHMSPTAPTRPSSPNLPLPRRRSVLIAALTATALLITGGVIATVKLTQNHNPAAAAPPTTAAAAPGMAPFTGTYMARFSAPTNMDGGPVEGAKQSTATWGVRSVCRTSGCAASASRLSGESLTVSNLVFDEIDGRWVAVAVANSQCRGVPVEIWEVFTLQPGPDGTLTGEYSETSSKGCAGKMTLTFTRTGDVDVNTLPNPAFLPPRVVSPAEALHGQYHQATTYADGRPQDQYDFAVRTDCLRTGDRCMSYFHAPSVGQPLLFADGKWTWEVEGDDQCPGGGQTHVKQSAQYPLPEPALNPIPLLTGHGHTEQIGSCPISTDIVQTFTRTGD